MPPDHMLIREMPPNPLPTFVPPTSQARDWVAAHMGPGARVVRVKRLVGGTASSVFELVVDRGSTRTRVVLRRWLNNVPNEQSFAMVQHEAHILNSLSSRGLPVPQLIAYDLTGDGAGAPSLLMTRVAGRVDLAPRNWDRWILQMAQMLPRIHSIEVDAEPFERWLDFDDLKVPSWTKRPNIWERAIELLMQAPPSFEPHFIHRDYQHFNVLWTRGKISGVVDWVVASSGPRDIDVGHCRLNLAVLFSRKIADRFLEAYASEAGRTVDPWWDLYCLAVFLPGWDSMIQVQAGSRAVLDRGGMNERVEDVVAATLARLT